MSDIRRSASWLADKLAEQDRRLNLVESRKPGLAQSSIEDGAIDEYTADGTFASSVGKQPDGSHVAFPATGPVPATPQPATLRSTPGLVEVRWNGKFENDDVSTLDFKHVAVHASTTQDVDTSPATQLATIRGELGDVASIVADEGTLYVRLVAWTAAGKSSAPSHVASVAVAAPANANLIQDALDDLDTKYDGVIEDAGQLDCRLTRAQSDLVEHNTRITDAETDLTNAFGQLGTVDARTEAAKQAAITAAAADATAKKEQAEAAAALDAKTKADAALAAAKADAQSKADAAKAAAIAAAAADATNKKEQAEANAAAAAATDAQARADAAQAAALAAAKTYADAQASGASGDALTAAKADATAKADAAKAAAIAAAAADATAKKEQAEANAAADAKTKADAVLASAKTDATSKSDAAKAAAIAAAAADATAKKEQAEANAAADAKTKADAALAAAKSDATSKSDAAKAAAIAAAATDAQAKADAVRSIADAAQAAADRAIESSRSYVNPFSTVDGIVPNSAPTPTVASSPTAMGGTALRKSGTGSGWYFDRNAKQAFDPVALYRLTVRMRVVTPSTSGGGKYYYGVRGFAADGETLVNSSGSASDSSQHYLGSGTLDTSGEWVDFVGYFRGNAPGNDDGDSTALNPRRLHAAVRYFEPLVILDYSSGNGVWEVSHLSIDVIDVAGQQALADAAAAKTAADNAAAAAAAAQTAAGAAQTQADAALTMATSKTKVYYSTATATGTGTTTGDLWRQRNASNEIIAEWQWSGTGWVKQTVSGMNVSNMDIGFLTAGAATMSQALIDKLVAGTANFQRADIKNLFATSGTLDTAVINKLWADVVNSRKITSQMIAVGDFTNLIEDGEFTALPPDSPWTLYSDGVIQPDSGRGNANALRCMGGSRTNGVVAQQFNRPLKAGDKYFATAMIYRGSTPTADTQIKMSALYKKIDGTSAGSATILFVPAGGPGGWQKYVSPEMTVPAGTEWVNIQLNVDPSFTGSVVWDAITLTKKVSAVVLEDGVVTAEKLQALLVLASDIIAGNPAGQHARMTPTGFKVLAPVDGGAPAEVVRMGNSDGTDVVAVVGADGLTKAGLNADGTVTGQDADIANDITLAGDSLLERLNALPHGVVAWRQFPGGSNSAWPTLGSAGGEVGLFEIGWDTSLDDPARLYSVSVPPILLKSASGSATTIGLVMRYTDDGSAPTVNSPRILHDYGYASAGGFGSRGFNDVLISSANGPYIRVLVTMYSNGAVGLDSTALPEVVVKDLGLAIPQTGSITTGGGGSNPPPTNPVVTKTVTYSSTSVQSYLGNNAQYNYNAGKGYQGLQPGTANGNLKSLWTFPSLTSLLTGATVNKIEAYFYFEHWYSGSGGTARIVAHGNSGQPTTYSSLILAISSPNWPRGAGRWVTIPSSLYAGFKSGTYKGFGLEGDGTYNTYGIANAAKIRVTYTK